MSSLSSAETLLTPLTLSEGAEVSASDGRRFSVLRRRMAVADVLAGLLSGLVTGALAGTSASGVAVLAASLALAWPVLAFICGLYGGEDLRSWASGVSEAPKVVLACLILSWPAFGLLVALGAGHAAVGGLSASLATAALAGIARATTRAQLHRSPSLRQRTVIVGSGVVARQVVNRLNAHAELGLEPVGFVDDEAHRLVTVGVPCLGDLDALPGLLETRRVDRVIIAFTRSGHEELLRCIRNCRDAGVAVDIVPRLFEFLDGARSLEQVGGMPLLSINAPVFSPLSRAAKRTLDVVVSSFALLAFSPLLLLLVAGIKLESRGPVFFTQMRVGRHGRRFRIFKFRSMHVGSEERKLDLVPVNDLSDGVMFKIYRDPRITRLGRLMRRFSIDELPQFINVLRGEMSLVGPRPLVLEEAAAMTSDWEERRVDLRPGLTGPWQISGRSHIPFQDMVRFDYQYVAGWSLARDVEILLATLPAVLSGRGAY